MGHMSVQCNLLIERCKNQIIETVAMRYPSVARNWRSENVDLLITTRRMPHTTQYSRLMKAPEHLYYLLLLATHARYARDPQFWRSWISMGFGMAVREGPPGTERAHHVEFTIEHNPRRFAVSIDGGERDTLARLANLLAAIESRRPALAQLDPEARADALEADASVREQLIDPVRAAFTASGLSQGEVDALRRPLRQALFSLSDPDIVSLEVGSRPRLAA
jgi:hypothetical protein